MTRRPDPSIADAFRRARRAEVIADLREHAAASTGAIAASFDHLADLLRHHERGFPNVATPRGRDREAAPC